MKHLRALTLAVALAGGLHAASAQGLRAEVGKPLQQAGEYLKAGKAREALAKVREAEGASGITANEVGSSRVDLQACKLEYSIVSPK